MRERLNDHAFLVHEDDVSVPEHLEIESALTVFGIEGKRQHTVKSDLLNAGQSGVAEVLSEHHGKRWRGLGHRAVSLGGVDSGTSYEDDITLLRFFWIHPKHNLLVMRHVGFFDVSTFQGVQLTCHHTEVKP